MQRKEKWIRSVKTLHRTTAIPLAAVLLLLLQMLYFPGAEYLAVVNLLLLALDLLLFLPLLKKADQGSPAGSWAGLCFLTLLAVIDNCQIGSLPSPLADPRTFFNSFCGVWLGVLALEAVGTLVLNAYRDRRESGITGFSASTPVSVQENGDGTASDDGEETRTKAAAAAGPGRSRERKRSKYPFGSIAFGVIFLAVALLAPVFPWSRISEWLESARGVVGFIFGEQIADESPMVLIVLYLVLMIAVLAVLVILWKFVLHIIGHAGREREGSRDSILPDFFEEYGTAAVVLIVVIAVVMAIRTTDSRDPGSAGFNAIDFVCNGFGWLIAIVVAIITLLVIFEAVRQVLKQCLQKGSLLKTAMRFIFVQIVEYTLGLLMGVLQAFALKDVLESLLLFFLPDLKKNSVEPRIHAMLKDALDMELNEISAESAERYRAKDTAGKRKAASRSDREEA